MILKSSFFEVATRQLMLLTYRFRRGVFVFWSISIVLAVLMLPWLPYDGSVEALLPQNHPRVVAVQDVKQRLEPPRMIVSVLKGDDFGVLVNAGEALFYPLMEGPSPWLNDVELDNNAPYLYRHALLLLTPDELQELITEHDRRVEALNPFFVDFEDYFHDSRLDSDSDSDLVPDFESDSDSGRNRDSKSFESDDELLYGQDGGSDLSDLSDLSSFRSLHDFLQQELGIPPRFRTRADSSLLVIEAFAGPKLASLGETELEELLRTSLDAFNQANNTALVLHTNLKRWQDSQRLDGISARILLGSQISLAAIFLFLWWYLRFLIRRKNPHQLLPPWLVPKLLVSILVVLGITVLLTLGVASAIGWSLNRFSILLLGIMLGVNADYLIHLASASVDFRRGRSVLRWIILLSRKTGKGMAFSLWTTAAAMTGLLFSGFPGFQSFGGLFLIGLLLNYLLTFTLFFLILSSILPDSEQGASGADRSEPANDSKPASADAGVASFLLKYPLVWRTTLLVILAAWGMFAVFGLQFRYDLSGLEPRSGEQQEFSDLYYNTVNYLDTIEPAFLLLDGLETAVQAHDHIADLRNSGKQFTQVRRMESLVHRIPSNQEDIALRVSLIQELRKRWLDDLGQLRIATDWIPQEQNYLIQALHAEQKIVADSLSYRLKHRFFDETGQPLPLIVLYPDNSLSSPEQSLAFKHDAGSLELPDGRTFYTVSSALVASSVLDLLQSELPGILSFALIGMFLGAWLAFGRLIPALWSCLATLGGFGLTFALLSLFGFELHLYNVVALPLLIGIGIDSSIHLMHSLQYTLAERRPWKDISQTTLIYVSASAFTTMLGFFGFLWIGYRGLMDLAVLAILGTLAIFLYTVLLLNTLFIWQQRHDR
jgi:uncharacterized protein